MKQEARPGDGLESPGFSRGEEVKRTLSLVSDWASRSVGRPSMPWATARSHEVSMLIDAAPQRSFNSTNRVFTDLGRDLDSSVSSRICGISWDTASLSSPPFCHM